MRGEAGAESIGAETMSSSRAGGGAGSAAIPANARKTVQSLKEIVPNGEEEIYSVLKECNMDPDETVQRLLNQGAYLPLSVRSFVSFYAVT